MGTKARRRAPSQHPVGRGQAGADYAGGCLEHTAERRSVAAIEHAGTRLGAFHDKADVLGGVKKLQLSQLSVSRFEHAHLRVESALLKFPQERAMAIGTEGMAVAEAVASQPLAEHYCNLRAFGVQRCTLSLSFRQPDRTQR